MSTIDSQLQEADRMTRIRKAISSLGSSYGTSKLPSAIVHYTSIGKLEIKMRY